MADETGYRFIAAESRPQFELSDWRDAVHLNEQGREKLTQFLAQKIVESGIGFQPVNQPIEDRLEAYPTERPLTDKFQLLISQTPSVNIIIARASVTLANNAR